MTGDGKSEKKSLQKQFEWDILELLREKQEKMRITQRMRTQCAQE